jgi:hypothetical protein
MSDLIRVRMLAMLDAEMKQVAGMISNETIWAHGSSTEEDAQMHSDNIAELEEYQETLLKLREQVVEGELTI